MKIPEGLDLAKAGPILCAGITMYDPLRYHGLTEEGCPKKTVGIVGIGGLGTMGVKLAKALGHTVVAISTSANKKAMAHEKGADHFVVSTDEESMATMKGKINLIINTVSANHQLAHYMPLLHYNGIMCQVGLAIEPHAVSQMDMIMFRKTVTGSHIGGIKATEDCLKLCAKTPGCQPDIQLITADQLDDAWHQLNTTNKDGVRFVIDIQKSLQNKDFIPK